jgi:hypothetical protein
MQIYKNRLILHIKDIALYSITYITAVPVTLIICGSVNSASAAVQPPPWRWVKDTAGASLTSEYFSSTANYGDTRGGFLRLGGDNSITTWESELRARYAIKEWASPYIGFGFGSTSAVFPTTEKSNAGLTDIHLGADFRIQYSWIRVFPQIEVSYPVMATDPLQTLPLTSEGVPWMRASVFLQKPLRYFAPYIHGGIKIPGEGLAKLFLYGAGAEVPVGDHFVLGGGIEGEESLIGDNLTAAERDVLTTASMSGSHRYWVYNPALLEARAWVRFRPDPRVWIRAGYAKTLNGIRAAEGQSIFFSLTFNVPWEDLASKTGNSKSDFSKTEPVKSEVSTSELPMTDLPKPVNQKLKSTKPSKKVFVPDDEVNGPNQIDPSLDETEKIMEDL